MGKFIAENLIKDPASKVLDHRTTRLLLGDGASIAKSTGPALVEKLKHHLHGTPEGDQERKLVEMLTKNLGEDNLVGSAGEFGLLLAFLQHSPRSKVVKGELYVSAEDVRVMFADHQFPEGWETWKKTAGDWIGSTTGLTVAAAAEFHRLDKARKQKK